MMSLPASKGFDIGSGFASTKMTGSEHNDAFVLNKSGDVTTASNYSGGIQGGITNGKISRSVLPLNRPQQFLPRNGRLIQAVRKLS